MRRTFKLTVEYDGMAFHGWQKQPGKRTVQGELEKAVRRLDPGASRVVGAGRTDAGVHAAGQAASVRLDWNHGTDKLAGALNSDLPGDVAVVEAGERPGDFDARRDARKRVYRYVILNRRSRSPLLDRYACRVPYALDMAAMRKAAVMFQGRHDFTAFCSDDAREKGTVRKITECGLVRRGDLILLDVSAPGFLHRMVRLMAGALLAVGSGRLTPDRIRTALKGGGTRHLADAAPARGLVLLGVGYPGAPMKSPVWPASGRAIHPRRGS